TASGGCNGVLTNNNTGAPSACGGSTTVTFTYTSACAPLTTTCQATFTVASSAAPVLTCPTPTTASACLTQDQLNTAYSNWLASATVSNGCSGGTLTNNAPAAPLICNPNSNTITVTFTYAGATCQTAPVTCTSTFTVPAYPTFTVPANSANTVACPALIVQPVPPTVVDGCGKTLTPAGPVIVNAPNPITCEGTRTFTWTYTDCAGLVRTWSHVTTVEREPFTVPANGAATVACPALATQPVPPVVLSNCGETLTPAAPVVTNIPNPLTCEGTRSYAFTYTDCEGNTATWTFTYTIERQPFAIATPPGSTTVACPDDTDLAPIPPVVLSNCGEVLVPVVTVSPKPVCEADRSYTFTYTDCEGNTASWVFIYNVVYQGFTVPANEVVSVECPTNASLPTPPTVFDNCGNLLTPVGPTLTSTTNTWGCVGSRTYSWRYTDCDGNVRTWGKTFNFLYSEDFIAPIDEQANVSCMAYATPPFAPQLYGECGELIHVSQPVMTQSLAAGGCSGWRKFSYVLTDCGGNSHPWSFTYYFEDTEAPLGTCPSGNSPVSVDVTNLACIGDVPCPDDYDFDEKIEELLAAGNYLDVCYGDELFVTLEDYTDLWECADPDGDGNFTFGRTFYFRIADRCGNEYPSLCEVTFSGACIPLTSFPQEAWGIMGGMPGSAVSPTTTDLQVISSLLTNGPVVIGGSSRSITIDDAQCVVNMLPGTAGPAVLANCQQTNCAGCNPMSIGGMKNVLAANAIALELNIRYNMQYNGLTRAQIRNQSLACIYLHDCIYYCDANDNCRVHFFDALGTEQTGSFTIGGLQDLVNLYLGGSLQMTVGQKVIYGTALNQSLLSLNAYYNNQAANACDNLAPDFSELDKLIEEHGLGIGNTVADTKPSFEVVPNPASSDVNIKFAEIAEGKLVSIEIINALGQKVMHRQLGEVSYVNERMDLGGIGNGIYFVRVKIGDEQFEQKLVISKN
nr:T9SS type A sorting domain-containing protein [Saprospiraceae bacterium]